MIGLDIIMIAATSLFIFMLFFVAWNIKSSLGYTAYALSCVLYLSLFLFFFQTKLGYPVETFFVDKEPQVVYAIKIEDYAYYWILEEDVNEPRAHKVSLDSEEEQRRFRETKNMLAEGKRVFLVMNSGSISNILVREVKINEILEKNK
jgi:hypothetical protein